ncbi:hypothetical protein [Mesorhizobium sp. M1406]|uniref:hypothetical protein n=1 Tax=Mesorhizobium sp. M1406 TaxID=2957099 RepID=UPI0033388B82
MAKWEPQGTEMVKIEGLFPGPFSGPNTQKAYQAALGQFLVAFNRIDNEIRRIIVKLLGDQGRPDLWSSLRKDMYLKQVTNLQLIALGLEWFPALPYDRMSELNSTRNTLAHGHYDQDLFSDNFQIVGRETGKPTTIEDVKASIEEALDLVSEIDGVWAHIWFEPPSEG